jgi:hypothetical protein
MIGLRVLPLPNCVHWPYPPSLQPLRTNCSSAPGPLPSYQASTVRLHRLRLHPSLPSSVLASRPWSSDVWARHRLRQSPGDSSCDSPFHLLSLSCQSSPWLQQCDADPPVRSSNFLCGAMRSLRLLEAWKARNTGNSGRPMVGWCDVAGPGSLRRSTRFDLSRCWSRNPTAVQLAGWASACGGLGGLQ